MFTILHTEASNGWGGQEIRIMEESINMMKRGHRLIIAASEQSGIFTKAGKAGIEVLPADFYKKNPANVIKMKKIIDLVRPDIVNTHSSSDSWIASIAARLSKTRPKLIRTRHLSTPVSRSFLSRLIYDTLPDAVMTTGESIKERMVGHNKFRAGKIFSIPTGIDIRRFDPDTVKPVIPKKGFMIGSIGVLRDWKGHHYLLEAVPLISEIIPDVFVYIVGDGPQYGNLREKMESLKLQDKVVFTGHREDIPEVLASLEVIVHPSYESEGIPQSILQAMAMKKPVVASDAGSISEVVINNQTGLLISPKDPRSIADKVIELYNNPLTRVCFGNNARSFIEGKHTMEIMVEKIERLYKHIMTE